VRQNWAQGKSESIDALSQLRLHPSAYRPNKRLSLCNHLRQNARCFDPQNGKIRIEIGVLKRGFCAKEASGYRYATRARYDMRCGCDEPVMSEQEARSGPRHLRPDMGVSVVYHHGPLVLGVHEDLRVVMSRMSGEQWPSYFYAVPTDIPEVLNIHRASKLHRLDIVAPGCFVVSFVSRITARNRERLV
jgi:hypothetical protein